jgi:hypothetical protein
MLQYLRHETKVRPEELSCGAYEVYRMPARKLEKMGLFRLVSKTRQPRVNMFPLLLECSKEVLLFSQMSVWLSTLRCD